MSVNIIDEIVKDSLLSLIQTENYVGRVYSIDYDKALVVSTDFHKKKVQGIPQNAFLIATSINPNNYRETTEFDKEVILLRVIGICKLPQDDDNIRTKLDLIQNATAIYADKNIDKLTANQIALCGLECRVLGTFYMKGQSLQLGSDIENFSSSLTQQVYIPKGESLKTIVNYVDPIRLKNSKEDFKKLEIDGEIEPFPIGTVRYTSTDRLQRKENEEKVSVYIQPSDFLARRTAVLGMTRTGKSNMVKQTVAVVKNISKKSKFPIGQLVFDINGEYANANNQDNGSISDVFKSDCVRYRMIKTEGFRSLLINFYTQLSEGFQIIYDTITEEKVSSAQDINTFINSISFDKPKESSLQKRYNVMIAIYKCLLYKAGFEISPDTKIIFEANENVRNVARKNVPSTIKDALDWFVALRTNAENLANDENSQSGRDGTKKQWFQMLLSSTKGKLWLDDVCVAMLNMIVCRNSSGVSMYGYRALLSSKEYHTPERDSDVKEEIYSSLKDGKIVILDMSVGNANLREKLSKDLAKYIFNASMKIFTNAQIPPNIMIYIEEAHNLIGKKMELTETWPRMAKEGAKYKIGLVYATQEVSSVHPNILSNTENWFVTHINNEAEVKELGKFYDFSDFGKSLLRAQDVGFARVKTLSSSFVVPVQIDKFDPSQWRE